MRSAKLKSFFLALLLGPILLAPQAFAVDEQLPAAQLKNDLNDIKTRLTTLEAQQKEILIKEDKILEELDRIRIWVHRK